MKLIILKVRTLTRRQDWKGMSSKTNIKPTPKPNLKIHHKPNPRLGLENILKRIKNFKVKKIK